MKSKIGKCQNKQIQQDFNWLERPKISRARMNHRWCTFDILEWQYQKEKTKITSSQKHAMGKFFIFLM